VGSDARSSAPLSYTPVSDGSRPVSSAARDGAHNGDAQYALSNTTPEEASSSSAGADAAGSH
jgi:hypothetical protein